MANLVNIIMYHYVRELSRSRYPDIKGLLVNRFREHLELFDKSGRVVTGQDIVASQKGQHELPNNAVWLTFDDGYSDHYNYVLPLLHEFGLKGTFFPPTKCIRDHVLLDVNAVHFILASTKNPLTIVDRLKKFIADAEPQEGLKAFENYWNENATANRFDPAEIIFIKRMLQHALPPALRRTVIDRLFSEFVSVDQSAFAEKLYLKPEQIRVMNDCGMEFGSHTHSHPWMDRVSADQQRVELEISVGYLKEIGIPMRDWVMCFPYGASDQNARLLASELGASVGVGTEVRKANLAKDDLMSLPRWDANDVSDRLFWDQGAR